MRMQGAGLAHSLIIGSRKLSPANAPTVYETVSAEYRAMSPVRTACR